MGKLSGKAKADFVKKMALARKKAAKSGKPSKKARLQELVDKRVGKVAQSYEKRIARLEKQLAKKKS